MKVWYYRNRGGIKLMAAYLLGFVALSGTLAFSGLVRYTPRAVFYLRSTVAETQKLCPTQLISMYEMLHEDKYFACDDGKNTTVLIFSKAKLVAIMDLKYFAKHER